MLGFRRRECAFCVSAPRTGFRACTTMRRRLRRRAVWPTEEQRSTSKCGNDDDAASGARGWRDLLESQCRITTKRKNEHGNRYKYLTKEDGEDGYSDSEGAEIDEGAHGGRTRRNDRSPAVLIARHGAHAGHICCTWCACAAFKLDAPGAHRRRRQHTKCQLGVSHQC